MKIPPPVLPAPLPAISHTRAEDLRDCPLRVAFALSPPHRDAVPMSTAARIGTICHEILAAAAQGDFDDTELNAAFADAWNEQLTLQEGAARASASGLRDGPPAKWPNINLRKARLRVRLRDLVEARRSSADGHGGHGPAPAASQAPGNQVEARYDGFGGRITGRPDLILRRDGEVVIRDYKTGTIFAPDDDTDSPAAEPAMNPRYRRQLLLYSALYHDQTGTWPAQAELVGLDGKQLDIPIDPTEASAIAAEALALLDGYNQRVAQGDSAHSLARPSPTTCASCSYCALCPPFWDAVSPSWLDAGFRTGRDSACLSGTIKSVTPLAGGTLSLDINASSGTIPPGAYRLGGLTGEKFPGVEALSPGMSVRVLYARPEHPAHPSSLRPGPSAQLWWSE